MVAPSLLSSVCCTLLCFLSVVTCQWLPGKQGQPEACRELRPGMHELLGMSRLAPHSLRQPPFGSAAKRAKLPPASAFWGLRAGNGAGVCSLPSCFQGMALQQCPKEAGAQGLPPKAGECRNWPADSSQPSLGPCLAQSLATQ